ncbi:hypothetical protein HYU91_00715 [Candidatus Collierbacteria bacterium]|nr:hypothetical protein [Candidatus Collierbacteria bacterium]
MGYASFRKDSDLDDLFEEAARFTIESQKASASLLQRRLSIGYARAARLIDQMEATGIVSPGEGAKPREVLISSYDTYLTDSNKEPVTVRGIEPIPDWVSADLSGSPFSSFQIKHKKDDRVYVPIGLKSPDKIVSFPISDIGGLLIYTNPICNSMQLLNLILEVVAGTYNPDIVKFIIYDDAGQLSADRLRASLITPVIKPFEKLVNALGWALNEMECRNKMFREVGAKNIEEYNQLPGYDPMPRIVIAINDSSDFLSFSDEVMPALQRIISSGNSAGIHPIVLSPMNEKKTAKILTTIPSKIVFKTFSVPQADMLGTDDAFDLSGPSEFIFIPPYGKVEKLSIKI